MEGRATVLYDDDCGVCRWLMVRILDWDRERRLEPVAIQDPRADALLDGMPAERRLASWHLVTPSGALLSGGEAVPELARLLPAGAPIGWLASTFQPLTNGVYRLVAGNRSRLGRLISKRQAASARARLEEHRRQSRPAPE